MVRHKLMTQPYASGKRWTLYLGSAADLLSSVGPEAGAVILDPPWGINGGRGGDAVDYAKGAYVGDWPDTPEYVAAVVVPVVVAAIGLGVPVAVTPGIRCAWLYPPPVDIGCFWQPAAVTHGPWGFSTFSPILYYGKDWRAGRGAMPSGRVVRESSEKNGHPCPKPIGPWRWLVDKVAPVGALVVDTFTGSGTTGVAALAEGRRFVGSDVSAAYLDIAARRLEQAEHDGVQIPLFGPA